MAPVNIRRSPASSAATVVSLSKLLHLVPAILSNSHVKRGTEFVIAGHGGGGEEGPPAESPEYMFKLVMAMAFVILGGVFAG